MFRHEAIRQNNLRVILLFTFFISFAFLTGNHETYGSRERKNVLVVHSYNPEFAWTQSSKEGIDLGFLESSYDVMVYHEFLDAKRFPDLQHKEIFFEFDPLYHVHF